MYIEPYLLLFHFELNASNVIPLFLKCMCNSHLYGCHSAFHAERKTSRYLTSELCAEFSDLFSEHHNALPFIMCRDFRFIEELIDSDMFSLRDNKRNQDS